MTPLRLEDLPPKFRRKLEAENRLLPSTPTGQRSRLVSGGTFRCHACKHETKSYAAAERHADAKGHVRIELLVETLDDTR